LDEDITYHGKVILSQAFSFNELSDNSFLFLGVELEFGIHADTVEIIIYEKGDNVILFSPDAFIYYRHPFFEAV
jgi:hypothetical protein